MEELLCRSHNTGMMTLEKSASLHVERAKEASIETTALLERTLWGTADVLYTMPSIRGTLAHVPHPEYLGLYKGSRLVGTLLQTRKNIFVGESYRPAVYQSMFAVEATQTGRGYGKSLLKESLKPFETRNKIVYAYVEAGNERSLHVFNSLGYQALGCFQALAFSRFFPQSSSSLDLLKESEQDMMIRLIKQRYQDHLLLEENPVLHSKHYYVWREAGEIVAGLQAEFKQWKIQTLGGLGGMVACRLLPHLPLLRRLFNPDNFLFLKFGHLYVQPGREKVLLQLMESILAVQGLNTSLVYLDPRSPVDRPLLLASGWGPLRALTATTVNVLGLGVGVQGQDQSQPPLVISPDDC